MPEQKSSETSSRIPTEQDAITILHKALDKETQNIQRFPTGMANYVYDVQTKDGQNLVVRLTRSDLSHFFEGAISWYETLHNIGVPLPKLYIGTTTDAEYGFPTMIMDRLEGKDLGDVYLSLTTEQKKNLAHQIVRIQQKVAQLPEGKGYGYARSTDDPRLLPHWVDVLDANLEKSRKRLEQSQITDTTIVDRVQEAIHAHMEYFSQVKPTCFLDDTTVKNVVINKDGNLSGIVDVDGVAFGDPLLTIALTRMGLIERGYDTEYTDYWMDELDLSNDQRKAIDLYAAMFAVDFLSSLGQQFNKVHVEPVDSTKIQQLTKIAETLASL